MKHYLGRALGGQCDYPHDVATCTCALAFTARHWKRLALVGTQLVQAGDGEPAHRLELRNCPRCGSTVSRRVLGAQVLP